MTGVCFMVLPASFSLRDGWGATVTAIPEHHGFLLDASVDPQGAAQW